MEGMGACALSFGERGHQHPQGGKAGLPHPNPTRALLNNLLVCDFSLLLEKIITVEVHTIMSSFVWVREERALSSVVLSMAGFRCDAGAGERELQGVESSG